MTPLELTRMRPACTHTYTVAREPNSIKYFQHRHIIELFRERLKKKCLPVYQQVESVV